MTAGVAAAPIPEKLTHASVALFAEHRRAREYNDAFEAILARGRAAPVFRADIPNAILIAHFFSDVRYLAQWYSVGGPLSKQRVAELTDLYLAGLKNEGAKR